MAERARLCQAAGMSPPSLGWHAPIVAASPGNKTLIDTSKQAESHKQIKWLMMVNLDLKVG